MDKVYYVYAKFPHMRRFKNLSGKYGFYEFEVAKDLAEGFWANSSIDGVEYQVRDNAKKVITKYPVTVDGAV